MRKKKLAIFIQYRYFNGVAQVYRNLAVGLLAAGYAVDFIVTSPMPELVSRLPGAARVAPLRLTPFKLINIFLMPFALAWRLAVGRYDVLIAGELIGSEIAILARLPLWRRTKLLLVEHDASALRYAARFHPLLRRLCFRLALRTHFLADGIVAVSQGVKRDLVALTGMEESRIRQIYNPVDLDDITARAAQPPGHAWFTQEDVPVLLTVSRISPEKDIGTLVQAFALLRRSRPCRLVIAGEGVGENAVYKDSLQALVASLGIAADVDMPGFVANPYSYMAHASAFVLASQSEGFGLVLVEAMACGCPVISTDVHSGPGEILDHGRWGMLVQAGDVAALAQAMARVLDGERVDAALLKERAQDFAAPKAIAAYAAYIAQLAG